MGSWSFCVERARRELGGVTFKHLAVATGAHVEQQRTCITSSRDNAICVEELECSDSHLLAGTGCGVDRYIESWQQLVLRDVSVQHFTPVANFAVELFHLNWVQEAQSSNRLYDVAHHRFVAVRYTLALLAPALHCVRR